jgi:hypothetical protein
MGLMMDESLKPAIPFSPLAGRITDFGVIRPTVHLIFRLIPIWRRILQLPARVTGPAPPGARTSKLAASKRRLMGRLDADFDE